MRSDPQLCNRLLRSSFDALWALPVELLKCVLEAENAQKPCRTEGRQSAADVLKGRVGHCHMSHGQTPYIEDTRLEIPFDPYTPLFKKFDSGSHEHEKHARTSEMTGAEACGNWPVVKDCGESNSADQHP